MPVPAARVAFVSGASRGIGAAVATDLGHHGFDVVLQYHHRRELAEAVATEVRAHGRHATIVQADVRHRAEVERAVQASVDTHGRLDAVVTAAGIYRGDPSDRVGGAEWDEVVQTDLEGTFRTIQAAAPQLRRQPGAAVVTISSILGSRPSAGAVPYQVAKAGIEHMTRALALEFAPAIRVNCVAPGFIRTDMNREAHTDPAFSRQVATATPLGRWGEPADVAPAVRYLLSERASWVTGSVLHVDGGLAIR